MSHTVKRSWIVACLLFFMTAGTVFSQESKSFVRDKVQFLVRGKALGMGIIEDRWVRTFSVGTEVKLFERFSFVADAVHFRYRYEEEVHDLPNPEKYSEYSLYDARNYLAFELRYYPQFWLLSNDFMPYVNVFSKFGKRRTYQEDKYPVGENDVLKLNSSFYDLGASIGFEGGKRFGIDINIGAAYRSEKKDEQIFHLDAPVTYNDDVHDYKWLPNIRLNLYWNFSR